MQLIFDILFASTMVTIGLLSGTLTAFRNRSVNIVVANTLCIYHFLFIPIYLNIPGDWIGYYARSKNHLGSWIDLFGDGTQFIDFLTYPFSNIIGLSSWACFFFYALLGYWGFLFLYLTINNYNKRKITFLGISIFPLILFLPNFHLWSVSIGKDTLFFLGISLFLHGIYNIKKNIFGFLLGGFIICLIRIHIGALLLGALGVTFFLNKNVSFVVKFLFLSFISVTGIQILPYFLIRVRLSEFSLDQFFSNLDYMSTRRTDSLTYVDLSDSSALAKMFAYLFRPLFYDAPNFFFFLMSFENIIWLCLCSIFINRFFLKWIRFENLIIQFSFIYTLVGVFLLSQGLSNFGIMMRQKTMFLPCLALLIIGFLQYKKEIRFGKKNKFITSNNRS